MSREYKAHPRYTVNTLHGVLEILFNDSRNIFCEYKGEFTPTRGNNLRVSARLYKQDNGLWDAKNYQDWSIRRVGHDDRDIPKGMREEVKRATYAAVTKFVMEHPQAPIEGERCSVNNDIWRAESKVREAKQDLTARELELQALLEKECSIGN